METKGLTTSNDNVSTRMTPAQSATLRGKNGHAEVEAAYFLRAV